jgi:hypothetical protein
MVSHDVELHVPAALRPLPNQNVTANDIALPFEVFGDKIFKVLCHL